jgi:hypothetical protein
MACSAIADPRGMGEKRGQVHIAEPQRLEVAAIPKEEDSALLYGPVPFLPRKEVDEFITTITFPT